MKTDVDCYKHPLTWVTNSTSFSHKKNATHSEREQKMNRIPAWVIDFIEENTDTEEDAQELYDYADCLVNDEGFTGEDLGYMLEEYVEEIL